MNNVGDIKTFTVPGGATDGSIRYVWKWWDSTVDVTTVPTIQKTLNQGGVNLPVEVEYCDALGHSATISTTITVNAPPVLTSSPTISANDRLFPFNTTMQATAYDPEAAGALSFAWLNGAAGLGSGITTIPSAGTYQNSLTVSGVSANTTYTQVITDADGGVTRLQYGVRGQAPSGLAGSGSAISNSIVSNSNNLSEVTIGPGATVTFTDYAQDSSAGQLQFVWTLAQGDGWAADFTFTETPAQLSNGSYKSAITRDVSAESAGKKIAHCVVTNLTTGQAIEIKSTVQLVAPLPPVISAMSTDAVPQTGFYKVLRDSFVHLTGTASDPNNLLLSYRWDFTQPAGVTLWGREIMLRPDQYAVFNQDVLVANGPRQIIGALTVTDRYNLSDAKSIQSFLSVQVWPL